MQLKIMDFDLAKANHEPEWHESLTIPQAGTTYYMVRHSSSSRPGRLTLGSSRAYMQN